MGVATYMAYPHRLWPASGSDSSAVHFRRLIPAKDAAHIQDSISDFRAVWSGDWHSHSSPTGYYHFVRWCYRGLDPTLLLYLKDHDIVTYDENHCDPVVLSSFVEMNEQDADHLIYSWSHMKQWNFASNPNPPKGILPDDAVYNYSTNSGACGDSNGTTKTQFEALKTHLLNTEKWDAPRGTHIDEDDPTYFNYWPWCYLQVRVAPKWYGERDETARQVSGFLYSIPSVTGSKKRTLAIANTLEEIKDNPNNPNGLEVAKFKLHNRSTWINNANVRNWDKTEVWYKYMLVQKIGDSFYYLQSSSPGDEEISTNLNSICMDLWPWPKSSDTDTDTKLQTSEENLLLTGTSAALHITYNPYDSSLTLTQQDQHILYDVFWDEFNRSLDMEAVNDTRGFGLKAVKQQIFKLGPSSDQNHVKPTKQIWVSNSRLALFDFLPVENDQSGKRPNQFLRFIEDINSTDKNIVHGALTSSEIGNALVTIFDLKKHVHALGIIYGVDVYSRFLWDFSIKNQNDSWTVFFYCGKGSKLLYGSGFYDQRWAMESMSHLGITVSTQIQTLFGVLVPTPPYLPILYEKVFSVHVGILTTMATIQLKWTDLFLLSNSNVDTEIQTKVHALFLNIVFPNYVIVDKTDSNLTSLQKEYPNTIMTNHALRDWFGYFYYQNCSLPEHNPDPVPDFGCNSNQHLQYWADEENLDSAKVKLDSWYNDNIHSICMERVRRAIGNQSLFDLYQEGLGDKPDCTAYCLDSVDDPCFLCDPDDDRKHRLFNDPRYADEFQRYGSMCYLKWKNSDATQRSKMSTLFEGFCNHAENKKETYLKKPGVQGKKGTPGIDAVDCRTYPAGGIDDRCLLVNTSNPNLNVHWEKLCGCEWDAEFYRSQFIVGGDSKNQQVPIAAGVHPECVWPGCANSAEAVGSDRPCTDAPNFNLCIQDSSNNIRSITAQGSPIVSNISNECNIGINNQTNKDVATESTISIIKDYLNQDIPGLSSSEIVELSLYDISENHIIYQIQSPSLDQYVNIDAVPVGVRNQIKKSIIRGLVTTTGINEDNITIELRKQSPLLAVVTITDAGISNIPVDTTTLTDDTTSISPDNIIPTADTESLPGENDPSTSSSSWMWIMGFVVLFICCVGIVLLIALVMLFALYQYSHKSGPPSSSSIPT